MGKREELLDLIESMKAEEETAKTYGDDWKRRDWKARQSMKAGELCLAVGSLTQAEAKAKRRPKSKGAKKARGKAKAYRRKLKELEAVLAESYSDYKATTPQYITTPGAGYRPHPDLHRIIRKDSGKAIYNVN